MRLLLDTCVLSELQKPNRSEAVAAFMEGLDDNSLFVSVITLGEIARGIALLAHGDRKSRLARWRRALSEQFSDRLLTVDEDTAEIWGSLTANGQQRGISIPVADGLIAATAIRHGLHVATRNSPHFEHSGAMIVDPWQAIAV